MRIGLLVHAALAASLVVTCAAPVRAQPYESIGIRAQGMAGAFVAIADDATATWWNPGGLGNGAYFNGVVEYALLEQPREPPSPVSHPSAAWQARTRGIALAFPAGGLSYYRLRVSEIQPPTPTGGSLVDRQDLGITVIRLRSLELHQFGATVGQSLGRHLVIGSTLKLVHGSIASRIVGPADATFDQALTLEGKGETHPDLDMGALATFGGVRVGLAVKNIRQPEFGPADDRQALKRQARAGFAVISQPKAVINQIVVAIDADLTTRATALGDARYVAGGVETWMLKRRIGLRAGVSANTIGERQMSPSGGVSLAARTGLYLEGQYTAGADQARHGWGFDLRVTF